MTVYKFDISLSDIDRQVYDKLDVRIARHELEEPEHLIARVLAYCLEYQPGITFARGMVDHREPTLWVRDYTGHVTHWIEVGTPNAKALHKGSKAADHVVIYRYKDASLLLGQLEKKKIFRARDIRLYALDPEVVGELAALLDRRVGFDLYVCARELFVTAGGRSFSGHVTEHQFA